VTTPQAPGESAREILAEPRFHAAGAPHPLRGVVDALSSALAPLGRPVGAAADELSRLGPVAWLLALLAIVLAVVLALRGVDARLDRAARRTAGGDGSAPRPDPARLERAAAEAERRGDLEQALRLRFQAGLLRLDAAEVVGYRASLRSSEVRAALARAGAGGGEFARLAAGFDAVAYGGRPATAEAIAEQRDGWRRVLDEAQRGGERGGTAA
jgi:hypothetical protein